MTPALRARVLKVLRFDGACDAEGCGGGFAAVFKPPSTGRRCRRRAEDRGVSSFPIVSGLSSGLRPGAVKKYRNDTVATPPHCHFDGRRSAGNRIASYWAG